MDCTCYVVSIAQAMWSVLDRLCGQYCTGHVVSIAQALWSVLHRLCVSIAHADGLFPLYWPDVWHNLVATNEKCVVSFVFVE